MKRLLFSAAIVLALAFQPAFAQTNSPATAPRAGGQGRGAAQPVKAKPEELAKIKEKTEQIESLVKDLKAKHAKPELVDDVEVFAHPAGLLLEFPDMFAGQA